MGKAFDKLKAGIDEITEWKAGETKANIHFGGRSYELTRPEHDAFRSGLAAGRAQALREAAREIDMTIIANAEDAEFDQDGFCRLRQRIEALAKP